MSLNDQFKADILDILTDAEFAEEITYTPHRGTPKTIFAIVNRQPASRMPEITDGRQSPDMDILIANDATDGVTAVIEGKDTITVAERYGGTVKVHTVTEVLAGDAGAWLLKVR